MSSLNWQDFPQNGTNPHAAPSNNLWFGVAMGLMGIIVGYAIGIFF